MARRGHHEGTIYKRADGRWEARLSLGYRAGKRLRKAFYGNTRVEVLRRLTAARRELDLGVQPIADERTPVSAFFARWLDDVARPSVRPTTFARYEAIVRLHINPAIGRIPIARLTPADVQALLNDCQRSGLAPRSVHHVKAVLRRGVQDALRWGLVSRNVATLANGPRIDAKEIRPLTPSEARRFLEAVRGDRFEALYVLALTTGVRQGEALGLAWEDVDLNAMTMRVRRTLQRVGGKAILGEPKSRSSRRVLALPRMTVEALRRHRSAQRIERLTAGSGWHENGFVFTTGVGTPLDATNVTHRLQRVLAQAGLPRQRFHDLRHACASLLLAQGVHPRVVMQTLGHSQIALTMNTYSHVTAELQRDAADEMQNVFAGLA